MDHDQRRREESFDTETVTAATAPVLPSTVRGGIMSLLTSVRCLLWGHELVKETDRDQEGWIERVRLSCIHCTKRTRGWSLK
jgi:hypothetical protein